MLNPSNYVHHLLPPHHDTEITSRLRKATTYPRPCNHTNAHDTRRKLVPETRASNPALETCKCDMLSSAGF